METSPLARKALFKFLRVQAVLLPLLFIPAWSLWYWEAWLYWGLLSICLVGINLYFLRHNPALMARRLDVGVAAEPKPSQKIIQGMAGAFTCALFVLAGLEQQFHGSSVSALGVVAADAVLLVALGLVGRVFHENRYTASVVRVEAGQPVIATGPYAWVRHPMYVGSSLVFLATPFALGSLWATIPAVFIFAMIVIRLLDEERYLSTHLPGYDAYCRQVRYRLLPYTW